MSIYDSTLTSKGQTTVPAEVREMLNLKPGDKIRYVIYGDKVFLRAKNKKAADIAGLLHDPNRPPLSVEGIDDAIGEHLAEEDRRIVSDWNRHQRTP